MKYQLHITKSEMREYCIDHNYYNSGTTVEYENLLNKCSEAMTADQIIDCAHNIFDHTSKYVIEKMERYYGINDDQLIDHIAWELCNDVATVWIDV